MVHTTLLDLTILEKKMEIKPTTLAAAIEEVSKTLVFLIFKNLVPSFLGRLAITKKEEAEYEILETF